MNQNLYNYLCERVGTENIIEIRRSFFKILESYYNEKILLYRVIFSGSKAEELDQHGSDIDLMVIRTYLPVYDREIGPNEWGIPMDTDNANPGFALLKTQVTTQKIESVSPLIVKTDKGNLLSNEAFKQVCLQGSLFGYHVHGPCLSTANEDADVAYCLQGKSWPKSAFHWIERARYAEWPPERMIYEIVEEGILFVPIGSKFGSKTDNKYEWRLSFSQAEKRLVHSFNHTELLCYAFLKIVLKDVLNQNTKLKGLLCSYYMKTAMFWLKEEVPSDIWKPKLLLHCFKECLKRIVYWIKCGYCPNYFVPENNMFAGKFDNYNLRISVAETLYNIFKDHIALFANSKVLKGFLLNRENTCNTMSLDRVSVNDIDACVFPLMFISKSIFVERNGKEILEKIYPIFKSNQNSKIKSESPDLRKFENDFNIITFAEVCKRFSHTMEYNFNIRINIRNSMLYYDYKKLLSHLLLSTHSGLNVWLLVALFFYQHKQYNNSIQAAGYFLSQTKPDTFVTGQYGKPYSRSVHAMSKSYEHISLPKRLKLACTEPFKESFVKGTFLQPCDLADMTCLVDTVKQCTDTNMPAQSMNLMAQLQTRRHTIEGVHTFSETFGHFIRFMCCHHLHEITEKNNCAYDIIKSLINQPEDSLYRFWSRPFVQRALTLTDTLPFFEACEYAMAITCFEKIFDSEYVHNLTKFA